jgi:hypothetical protein
MNCLVLNEIRRTADTSANNIPGAFGGHQAYHNTIPPHLNNVLTVLDAYIESRRKPTRMLATDNDGNGNKLTAADCWEIGREVLRLRRDILRLLSPSAYLDLHSYSNEGYSGSQDNSPHPKNPQPKILLLDKTSTTSPILHQLTSLHYYLTYTSLAYR